MSGAAVELRGGALETCRQSSPTAMPPRRALPVTTVRAQPALASRQVLLSNSPLCHESPALAAGLPAIAALGSSFSSAGREDSACLSIQGFNAY